MERIFYQIAVNTSIVGGPEEKEKKFSSDSDTDVVVKII
jgi:hypothetical protein